MILLGLGSNMGKRLETLMAALADMQTYGIKVEQVSSFYETPAWGITRQNAFVNAVCSISYEGIPEDLLDICQAIERTHGRKRMIKWGPRTLDIDILEFKGLEVETDRLILPHPFYLERAFVILPLLEIVPTFIPTGQTDPIEKLSEQFREEAGSISKLPS
ncbi:MAG: 2-amino-4-hydroxy-6-hydroxymethyldihydropteridine diphosphokinase [Bacteroidota bacterium]